MGATRPFMPYVHTCASGLESRSLAVRRISSRVAPLSLSCKVPAAPTHSGMGGEPLSAEDARRQMLWRQIKYMLQRSSENPAMTSFISAPIERDGERALRAFLLKPLTGRTHQLRVAMKSLGSPVLGDPMYAASAEAAREQRAYLHATALRIPRSLGSRALCDSDDERPIEVLLPPDEGPEFETAAFHEVWRNWFQQLDAGGEWFAGTAVNSAFCRE